MTRRIRAIHAVEDLARRCMTCMQDAEGREKRYHRKQAADIMTAEQPQIVFCYQFTSTWHALQLDIMDMVACDVVHLIVVQVILVSVHRMVDLGTLCSHQNMLPFKVRSMNVLCAPSPEFRSLAWRPMTSGKRSKFKT